MGVDTIHERSSSACMHQQAQQGNKNSSNIHFSTECTHVLRPGETFIFTIRIPVKSGLLNEQ